MSNTVPNLDAMSADSLMDFWHKYHRPGRKDAAALIGDTRKGYTRLASDLANYACNKAVAMRCRESGDISTATMYEGIAERIYNDLPADLHW